MLLWLFILKDMISGKEISVVTASLLSEIMIPLGPSVKGLVPIIHIHTCRKPPPSVRAFLTILLFVV